jgi:hypothetical protein
MDDADLLRTPVLGGDGHLQQLFAWCHTAIIHRNMSAPFFRAVRASLSFSGASNCTCRHGLQSRKARVQKQLRDMSSTPYLLSGHSYAQL